MSLVIAEEANMKNYRLPTVQKSQHSDARRGSTLVIVIALLGLLLFTGIVFFTFAVQEQRASEYFIEAAKSPHSEPQDVWGHMLEQLIVGPNNRQRGSKLWSPMRRHSMIGNLFGNDVYPHTGTAIEVTTTDVTDINSNTVRLPVARDGLLNMVDSPSAWGYIGSAATAQQRINRVNTLFTLRGTGGATPEPDVDYTYPDLNTMFLAQRGYAVATDSGGGAPTLVPYIIPSFFRPQYLRSAQTVDSFGARRTQGGVPSDVPTDPFWAYAQVNNGTGGAATPEEPRNTAMSDNRDTVPYQQRHFRPHPRDIAGITDDGQVVLRYLTEQDATDLGVAAGGFPLLPENDSSPVNEEPAIQGELGVWTGSHPLVYELDFDNDGDGIREGILLDLHYPVQEVTDSSGASRQYVVLHSLTAYDLDSLLNLNAHGNLAGLPLEYDNAGTTEPHTLRTLFGEGELSTQFVSKSNLGLGPNEVNIGHALRRSIDSLDINRVEADARLAFHLNKHFGAVPTNDLELANMVQAWLMYGRGEYDVDVVTDGAGNITVNELDFKDIISGRWGDPRLLFASLEQRSPELLLTELPRPGRSGNVFQPVSTGVSFGGRQGFDDNSNRLVGEPLLRAGLARGFRHPMDFSGGGMHYSALSHTFNPTTEQWTHNGINGTPADPRIPILLHDSANSFGPERFRGYIGYSASRQQNNSDPLRYGFGADATFQGRNALLSGITGDTADDLIHQPAFDTLFEDPLETIMEHDAAVRPIDDLFGINDLLALHLSDTDFDPSEMSERLTDLVPHVFARNQTWKDQPADATARLRDTPDNRQMFTTLSNDFRFIRLPQPFGADMRPGRPGPNGGPGRPWDVLSGADTSENRSRWWEFTADSDGFDRDDDGFADGDGHYEFPPRFWSETMTDGLQDAASTFVQTFSETDPFRGPVRRLLKVEAGEQTDLVGGLPLSLNHILDVDFPESLPPIGSRRYRALLQRSGLRFRELTAHPDVSETGVVGENALLTTSEPHEVQFPPETVPEREYWARLDRQRMARDIYVLLYTIGGMKRDVQSGFDVIKDYTGVNDPAKDEDSTDDDALYTHEQLRRMAQFAVNLVDAMDKDSVMTKFEYDKNLGDGWGLDDNPYTEDFAPATDVRVNSTDGLALDAYQRITAFGTSPEDSGRNGAGGVEDEDKRGVVYGVEAQELSFSEVLAFRSDEVATGDHEATPYDDTLGSRDFLHVELQSLSPNEIDLAATSSTSADRAIWRIVRMDRTLTDVAGAMENFETVREPLRATRAIAITEHVENVVAGGGRFSIGVANDTSLATTSIFLDLGDATTGNFDGTYELISPEAPTVPLATGPNTSGSTDPAYEPLLDIDTLHPDHTARFDEVNGNFLEDLNLYHGNNVHNGIGGTSHFAADTMRDGFDLVLQRRANPNMPAVDLVDNPWVEVDRTRVIVNPLGLIDSDTPATLFQTDAMTGVTSGKIVEQIVSLERDEPLDSTTMPILPNSPAPVPQVAPFTIAKAVSPHRRSSIKGGTGSIPDELGVNSRNLTDPTLGISSTNVALPFNLWQPHFDRDYASPGELLSLPLYSPSMNPHRLTRTRLGPYQQGNLSGTPDQSDLAGAAAMFLLPDFPDIMPPTVTAEDRSQDNAWYRLFQFVEVPSRVNRMLGNYLNQRRLPGKLNLNTVRHLEVYAGLLDDPFLAGLDRTATQTQFLQDETIGPNPRDRWAEFISERDGDAVTTVVDPALDHSTPAGVNGAYQINLPGIPGEANPFRSLGNQSQVDAAASDDGGANQTLLRQLAEDLPTEVDNRHWLEVGAKPFHRDPSSIATPALSATTVQRHQLLSKIMNNTTNVSNTFVVYGTAAYYEAFTDPATGFVRVGGRIDLDDPGDNGDLTEDASEDHQTGWQQRAVFVIDRTDALSAFDPASGTFDWQRLVKVNVDLPAQID